ncbi:MAG TPA: ribonuclease P protein component [Planctomycetota bacterium]
MAGQNDGKRERLAAFQRLHDPRDFQRVYAAQKALHARDVVMFMAPNGLTFARLGVSVGCKHGNAVRRNRIKRVLRAAFRQSRELLPAGFDYVLVPRKGVAEYNTQAVRETLARLAKKVCS